MKKLIVFTLLITLLGQVKAQQVLSASEKYVQSIMEKYKFKMVPLNEFLAYNAEAAILASKTKRIYNEESIYRTENGDKLVSPKGSSFSLSSSILGNPYPEGMRGIHMYNQNNPDLVTGCGYTISSGKKGKEDERVIKAYNDFKGEIIRSVDPKFIRESNMANSFADIRSIYVEVSRHFAFQVKIVAYNNKWYATMVIFGVDDNFGKG